MIFLKINLFLSNFCKSEKLNGMEWNGLSSAQTKGQGQKASKSHLVT